MCWTNEHVRQWVQWAIKEFSLKDVDVAAFKMTGQELCKFTREEFLRLAPAYNGDILMAHLCVLRKGKCRHEFIIYRIYVFYCHHIEQKHNRDHVCVSFTFVFVSHDVWCFFNHFWTLMLFLKSLFKNVFVYDGRKKLSKVNEWHFFTTGQNVISSVS